MPSPASRKKKPFFPREGAQSPYSVAQQRYAALGVDSDAALLALAQIPLSLPCWQGDDVQGFEPSKLPLSGGIAATGSYPGRARTLQELRQDLEFALSLIPAKHRLNLHASYGDFGPTAVPRDAIEPEHFQSWITWAKTLGIGLDFNPTLFSHPKAVDGFTLSHPSKAIRKFWIEHAIRSRRIGAAMGRALHAPSVTNLWIPDGSKDSPADRLAPRKRLADSLDEIFAENLRGTLDSLEPKLFGIGSESYVVGSHEFYLAYALSRKKLLCLDSGHYHPTENVADKITSLLQFFPQLLLHLSRGIRWDSDHVVIQNDELLAITREIIANRLQSRVRIGLDSFDASINRVAAWVIGARATQRALLIALLEPTQALREAENQGDPTGRLALQEEIKALPFGAVWERFCEIHQVPPDHQWIAKVRRYEADVLARRS
ncbi:MAG: L-rhamnose isomerase [Verrucomicrobiota bacterium]